MIRVNIHAGPINKANRYNMVALLDIAYERLEPIAHYKTVLFEAGIGATLPVQLEGYPRWSASLWDLTARALALGLSPDPDNPTEAVPEVTEGAPRRFGFAREICAQIDHLPSAGVRRRNLGSVEITQAGPPAALTSRASTSTRCRARSPRRSSSGRPTCAPRSCCCMRA
jgi:hypothetical protein